MISRLDACKWYLCLQMHFPMTKWNMEDSILINQGNGDIKSLTERTPRDEPLYFACILSPYIFYNMHLVFWCSLLPDTDSKYGSDSSTKHSLTIACNASSAFQMFHQKKKRGERKKWIPEEWGKKKRPCILNNSQLIMSHSDLDRCY